MMMIYCGINILRILREALKFCFRNQARWLNEMSRISNGYRSAKMLTVEHHKENYQDDQHGCVGIA